MGTKTGMLHVKKRMYNVLENVRRATYLALNIVPH